MASLTPLGATLLTFAEHEEPSRKLQEFRPHAERMVAAAASGICSAWSVEVSGSIASGTATRDSDLDLLIRTSGNDATREQRMQLRRSTVDRFMACPLVKQQASVTEKVREKGDRVCVTWYQEGHEVCVDLVFDSKTHGPIVAHGDASKFDSVPHARQAVKLFKVMMASNPHVPEVAGYLVEGIATYCLSSRAQSSPADSIALFLDMCDYVGSRSQQHQQFNSDLLPILPTPKIMAAGQLRSLAQHASKVLNLCRCCVMVPHMDVEVLLRADKKACDQFLDSQQHMAHTPTPTPTPLHQQDTPSKRAPPALLPQLPPSSPLTQTFTHSHPSAQPQPQPQLLPSFLQPQPQLLPTFPPPSQTQTSASVGQQHSGQPPTPSSSSPTSTGAEAMAMDPDVELPNQAPLPSHSCHACSQGATSQGQSLRVASQGNPGSWAVGQLDGYANKVGGGSPPSPVACTACSGASLRPANSHNSSCHPPQQHQHQQCGVGFLAAAAAAAPEASLSQALSQHRSSSAAALSAPSCGEQRAVTSSHNQVQRAGPLVTLPEVSSHTLSLTGHSTQLLPPAATHPHLMQLAVTQPSCRNPFACNGCRRTFRSASALQAHMLASHGLQMTVLQQLGSDNGLVATASLPGNNTAALLMPAASSQPWSLNPCLCDECNRSYPSQQALAAHKRAVHLRFGEIAVPAPVPGNTRFSCSQCNRLYGSIAALEAHVLAVHQHPPAPTPAPGHNPVPCPHCERTYKTQAAMEQHVAASHNLATTYPSSGPGPYTNPFPCTNCQRSFTSAAALAAHRLQQQH